MLRHQRLRPPSSQNQRTARRYRLKFRNASDDIHLLHLHRHSLELVRVGGKPPNPDYNVGVARGIMRICSWVVTPCTAICPRPA